MHRIGMTFGGEASSKGLDEWAGDNNCIDDAAEGLWMMPFYNKLLVRQGETGG
jgi:hypothetical protein